MKAERDPDRERRFLHAASPLVPAFREHACRRLAAGEVEYGDSWATRPIEGLLSEIIEECADIGAWAALTDQAVDRTEFDQADRELITEALLDAARLGAFAWARIATAQAVFVEARPS
jgi:hypothetical protein